ncbi:MAG: diaminopimelate epimerase [Candidatus Cloacimonetes bacterium]|nr:diaminopimelate epimerase [Candidatus Cloacimonadota bacterium]
MKFFKMHAQGNDYIYFDLRERGLPAGDLSLFAQAVADRHTGVGGDGIVMLLPAGEESVHAAFRIWNADGSEAETCGNALRCVTAYLCDKLNVDSVFLRTAVGLRQGIIGESSVRVDMGLPGDACAMSAQGVDGWFVDMGNPHLVIFTDSLYREELMILGPRLEGGGAQGVNVHLVHIIDERTLEMMSWERGAGMTLACGSGACAAVQAARSQGIESHEVEVRQPGGTVSVRLDEESGHLWLEGTVSPVCTGRLDESFLIEAQRG